MDDLKNPVEILKWIESQDPEVQVDRAVEIFDKVYAEAAQPKSVSGNACVKLCGLVEQTSKSESESVKSWAFSFNVVEKLFTFYIDWNEYDHHRSMRLVLDLIALLLRKNPQIDEAATTKRALLTNLISIITGRSTKPVAKSAIKTIEHFLSKSVFTLEEIRTCYASTCEVGENEKPLNVWSALIADLFQWMTLHFVCPAAGKFIVCLYRSLRLGKDGEASVPTVDDWHSWLLDFLTREPLLVERIKNYIFLPLFNLDRNEALLFLQRMNETRPVSSATRDDVDIPALLQLAALETGKKVGLVEEPALGDSKPDDKDKANASIILHEKVLESVLVHPSHEVRSLAFSILITSPSTTKPYSSTALYLLRKHMGAFFADSDAKFRVDVSAGARDMFRRVRGAIFVLKRSIPRAKAKAEKAKQAGKGGEAANASGPVLYRTNLISLPETQLQECLDHHETFLRWYFDFLCEELVPTASYQRHIASLKALIYILRLEGQASKTWETADDQAIFFDVFDNKWMRALFDLLMDPFDDVRNATATVLRGLFSDARFRKLSLEKDCQSANASKELIQLSQKANELARRTSRADHADGVARIGQLLYKFLGDEKERLDLLSQMIKELDRKITLAEMDLGRAVLDVPVHGDFAALCCTWQVVSELKASEGELKLLEPLQQQLVSACERIWNAVKDVLCDDSPEGHLPQELEEMEGLDTKSLLSYSFRAVHESSNLMRSMILAIRNRNRAGAVLPTNDMFRKIGNLTFTQLCTLRHRGAFTTVSATFTACCQQSKHLDKVDGAEDILVGWYKDTLEAIGSQISTTRRSAGIPSLMTGILSANADEPSFDDVMKNLLSIARIEAFVSETDGSKLPQVHAYNCLKDIFKNSLLTSLGNKSEKYLPECLELAASGLRSEVWAIRNCGLILLRSLIDCLFGSHESKTMIEAGWDGKANRIPYHRYLSLPEVLRSLLESGHKIMSNIYDASSAAESVFPALDIIRRAGPPDLLRAEIQSHIIQYLASPVWHVREMAARSMCSCLLHDQWLVSVKEIFHSALASTTNNQNYVHGALLMLKFVFERLGEVSLERITTGLTELTEFLGNCPIDTKYIECPDVVAAYLEVVNLVWMFQLERSLPLHPTVGNVDKVPGSALFRAQKVINDIITISQQPEPMEPIHNLFVNQPMGVNTLITALETLPKLWDHSSSQTNTLVALCNLYIDVSLESKAADAQTVCVNNLAIIIDSLLKSGNHSVIPTARLLDLWQGLPQNAMSPGLSNAITRASGGIIATIRQANGAETVNLPSWGMMIAEAGLEDKSFDTRFAAAESLRSYFSVVRDSCNSLHHLTALLALYDALNDDDEEVRDVGSDATRNILGSLMVPLEAAPLLLSWLAKQFGAAPEFKAVVCARAVGQIQGKAWKSAADELAVALKFDDSLFAIEEQNLFIDEVRETLRWLEVFESLKWTEDEEPITKFSTWLGTGLEQLKTLLQTEDGPLGWASNPHAFAICMRIVRGASSLAKVDTKTKGSLSEVVTLVKPQSSDVSRLLINPLMAQSTK